VGWDHGCREKRKKTRGRETDSRERRVQTEEGKISAR